MPRAQRARPPRHRTKPDPLAKAVGALVRKLREERDFTFDAFVEEVGLGRGYVSELDRGMVVPTITTLSKIAAALELTMADLLLLGDSPRERLYEVTRSLAEKDVAALVKQAETLLRNRKPS